MKCKNIECFNETNGKNIYCSMSCRNIYVNKYLRDYSKVSETIKNKGKEKEKIYLENPKKCKECNKIITFDKKDNEYCGHSCSASSVNGTREYTWGNKIRESINKYLESNPHIKSKKIGKERVYELKCGGCGNNFNNKRGDRKYCSDECRKKYRKNRPIGDNIDYKQYRTSSNFKFSLNDYPEEFDFTLIEKYGWYSPSNKKDNLEGVSRDHMLSVNEGFKLGIDPEIISHPANCRLIKHTDNISKNKKSIITKEELLERIKNFEEKYKI